MNKPRVALYYDVLPSTGFRNDGPPLFLHTNLRMILDPQSLDYEKNGSPKGLKDSKWVMHLSPLVPNTHFGIFDLNILVDYGEDGLGIPLDWEIPHPNAYWVSDAHLGYDYRLQRAKQFDWVFCCQKRCLEEFARDGIPREKLVWLPHAVDPLCYRAETIIPKWDWAFIGYLNSPERMDLLDAMLKEFPKGYIGWRMPEFRGFNVLEDAAHKYAQAKIVPNKTIKDDISMRIFETLACRRLCLTNDIPTLHDLFTDGTHLVMYRSVEEAVRLVKDLLADEERREAIAEAGYQEVLLEHTYKHRALEILKTTLNYEEDVHADTASLARR